MADILVAPVITEKAMGKLSQGIYTFKVSSKANKVQIARAVSDLYKVEVINVHVINNKSKKVLIKGKFSGSRKAWKKAIVALKKGQKIPSFEEK